MSLTRARRPYGRLLGLAALILGLWAATSPPALASSGPPAAVFDPDRVDWEMVVNRSSSQYAADFERLTHLGYLVVDLEVMDGNALIPNRAWQEDDGTSHPANPNGYSAIFQRNVDGRSWRQLRGMSRARFQQEHSRALADGMRIVDLEVYTPDTDPAGVSYAAVWVENREQLFSPYGAVTFGREQSEFTSIVEANRQAGMLAIDVEEYHVAGCERCYSAIFVENRDHLRWQLDTGLSSAQFAARFDTLSRSGLRMMAVASQARWDDKPLLHWCRFVPFVACGEYTARSVYAGLWMENRHGRGWAERRDMTYPQLQQRHQQYVAAGMRPIAFEAYKVRTGSVCDQADNDWESDVCVNTYEKRYAAIWRQNT